MRLFLGRRDILGAAETGSGKTLAFGLPILTGILKMKEKGVGVAAGVDDESDDGEADGEYSEETGRLMCSFSKVETENRVSLKKIRLGWFLTVKGMGNVENKIFMSIELFRFPSVSCVRKF